MAAQCHAEHGGERQQQRKRRQEGVISQQGHQVSGFVVTEFFDYRDGEPDDGVPLLPAVESTNDPLDRIWRWHVSLASMISSIIGFGHRFILRRSNPLAVGYPRTQPLQRQSPSHLDCNSQRAGWSAPVNSRGGCAADERHELNGATIRNGNFYRSGSASPFGRYELASS